MRAAPGSEGSVSECAEQALAKERNSGAAIRGAHEQFRAIHSALNLAIAQGKRTPASEELRWSLPKDTDLPLDRMLSTLKGEQRLAELSRMLGPARAPTSPAWQWMSTRREKASQTLRPLQVRCVAQSGISVRQTDSSGAVIGTQSRTILTSSCLVTSRIRSTV